MRGRGKLAPRTVANTHPYIVRTRMVASSFASPASTDSSIAHDAGCEAVPELPPRGIGSSASAAREAGVRFFDMPTQGRRRQLRV